MTIPTPAELRQATADLADAYVALAHQVRAVHRAMEPYLPAQDEHTPREQPQTRSGGTESGEGVSGALRVFFGGDDERRMWTWECTKGHPAAFGDEPTEYKAFGALVQHWKTRHPHDLERLAEIKETAPELAISAENASEPAKDLRSAGQGTAFTADDLYAARDRFAREERDALRRQVDYLRSQVERVRALAEAGMNAQALNRAALARGELMPGKVPGPEDILAALDGAGPKAGGNVTDRARVAAAEILSPDASDALRAEVERRLRVAYGEDA